MHELRRDELGFTLVELLVTMGIVLIVLTAAYQGYTRLLRGFFAESSSASAQMEAMVNTNVFRLDITHAGYGLARDLSNRPIQWNNVSNRVNRALTIRSTVNNLQEETLGWILCYDGNMIQESTGNASFSSTAYVFLNQDKNFESTGGSCPASGIRLGYPYDGSPPPGGCSGTSQPCYNVTYTLSGSQDLDTCAEGTRNLLRTASGGAAWEPVFNCVADWRVTFELDTDADQDIETTVSDISTLSVDQLYDQVELINAYILLQEGNYQKDFSFSGSTSQDGVNLSLSSITDSSHYRWKIQKISVKPQDM